VERLWAPWRIRYIENDKSDGCIFCTKQAQEDDTANHVVWRGERAFVLLNRYPYNNGHLMVAPYAHTGDLEDLTAEDAAEVLALCQDAVRVLKQTFKPDGLNVGLNLGAAAGAGVKDHLHFHIVPRWAGDTNFMSVVADVRVIPQSLDQAHHILVQGLEDLRREREVS
jgi:ATP adenylyltransferase